MRPRGGVDLNRNYPFGWGSNLGVTFAARGSGPGSEPEVKNTMEIVQRNQVVSLLTQHTNSRAILYPGLEIFAGQTPDLDNGYRDLALAMAHATNDGYTNVRDSAHDYETSGETVDWSYYATRGIANTLELVGSGAGCPQALPDYLNCTTADYTGTPGPRSTAAQTARFQGHPVRNAIWLNLIYATLAAAHSQITGTAVPGATLKITKDFNLYTAPIRAEHDGRDDGPTRRRAIPTHLESSIVVPANGRVHVGRQPVRAPGPGVRGRRRARRPARLLPGELHAHLHRGRRQRPGLGQGPRRQGRRGERQPVPHGPASAPSPSATLRRVPAGRRAAAGQLVSVTSPALSAVVVPSGRWTSSAPASSMPAPRPSPPSQRTGLPSSASRSRSAASVAAFSSLRRASSADEQLGQRRLDLGLVAPERARHRGGVGRERGHVDGDVDADAQHRPSARLDEDARDLLAVDPDVVGPLHQRARPGDVGHREPGAQREQLVELAQDQRRGDRDAGRRGPAPALAAAAGGLLAGRDQRAVRGALLGQFARALVGRADRLVVLAGFSEAHVADVTASASSAATRPSGVCGSASRSGSAPSSRSAALRRRPDRDEPWSVERTTRRGEEAHGRPRREEDVVGARRRPRAWRRRAAPATVS